MTSAAAALGVVAGETSLDGAWASERWDAAALGVPARRGRGRARFDTIGQPWLRDPVKRWSRFRLATGCAMTTVSAGALALSRFSRFLAECHPEVDAASGITRPVLEDFLAWLLEQGYSPSTRALTCSMIRVFFDACHRHCWLVGLGLAATIYVDELPFHHENLARFIPELVMAQIESDDALDQMRPLTARHLLVLLIETGLRGGDACNLVFNPVVADSTGWPCLRFDATKVRAEQLVPLSAKAAETIAAQQDHVRAIFPAGSPWLVPGSSPPSRRSRQSTHMTDTPSALAAANSRRHHAALSAARRAINDLQADGTAVTFTTVAKASGVARSWLYDNAETPQLIGTLRGAAPRSPRRDQRASAASRHGIADTLRLEIARLREENTKLREQLARQLGINRAMPKTTRANRGEDMSSPSPPAPTSSSS